MMYYGPGTSGWMMALMIFGNVVFWTVLVLAAVMVVRLIRRDSPGDSGSAAGSAVMAPQQLLAERFARGEISEDEYLHALKVLTDSARPPLR